MIEYKRDGKVLALLWPEPERYTAVVDGDPICDVEVSAKIIAEWGRVCALGVAHLLPEGCDPVVRMMPFGAVEWTVGLHRSQRLARDAALAVGMFDCARTVGAHPRWAWEAAHNAVQAVRWAALEADGATLEDGHAAWAAAEDAQRAHLHRLIWTAHGQTLTTRARVELARDLRYRGEEEAAAAVLPVELREVAT